MCGYFLECPRLAIQSSKVATDPIDASPRLLSKDVRGFELTGYGVRPSPGARRLADRTVKEIGKMSLVGEPADQRDLAKRLAACEHELLGSRDPPVDDVSMRGGPKGLFEGAAKMATAERREVGKHFDRDWYAQMLLDMSLELAPLPGCETAPGASALLSTTCNLKEPRQAFDTVARRRRIAIERLPYRFQQPGGLEGRGERRGCRRKIRGPLDGKRFLDLLSLMIGHCRHPVLMLALSHGLSLRFWDARSILLGFNGLMYWFRHPDTSICFQPLESVMFSPAGAF